MQFDFTGITDSGSVTLTPGRYDVSTQGNWTASETQGGHMRVYVPFTVQGDGEFSGASSAYYHTVMASGEPAKIRANKVFTLRLFTALGLLTENDRLTDGSMKAEFKYGGKDDNGRTAITALMVNGEERKLEGRSAIAVVTVNPNTQSGIAVDRLEPAGKVSPPVGNNAKEVNGNATQGSKPAGLPF